jgi:hypothetical protein
MDSTGGIVEAPNRPLMIKEGQFSGNIEDPESNIGLMIA